MLNKNNENNQKDFDSIINKSSKSTKNVERIKKEKKLLSTEKINRNLKNNDIKVSYSMDLKFNKVNENKKKINYKPIKIKEEYDDIENKLNFNLFSTKSKINTKKKLSNSYLTSIKKTKNASVDKSSFIQPKRLFQNNSILPPIQNK